MREKDVPDDQLFFYRFFQTKSARQRQSERDKNVDPVEGDEASLHETVGLATDARTKTKLRLMARIGVRKTLRPLSSPTTTWTRARRTRRRRQRNLMRLRIAPS